MLQTVCPGSLSHGESWRTDWWWSTEVSVTIPNTVGVDLPATAVHQVPLQLYSEPSVEGGRPGVSGVGASHFPPYGGHLSRLQLIGGCQQLLAFSRWIFRVHETLPFLIWCDGPSQWQSWKIVRYYNENLVSLEKRQQQTYGHRLPFLNQISF